MSRSIHQSKRILRPSSREALSSQRRRAHQRAIIRSRSEPFTRQRRSSIALARIWHSKIRRRSPQTTCCTTCERSCRKCRRPPRNVKPTPLRERHRSRRACNSRSSGSPRRSMARPSHSRTSRAAALPRCARHGAGCTCKHVCGQGGRSRALPNRRAQAADAGRGS